MHLAQQCFRHDALFNANLRLTLEFYNVPIYSNKRNRHYNAAYAPLAHYFGVNKLIFHPDVIQRAATRCQNQPQKKFLEY